MKKLKEMLKLKEFANDTRGIFNVVFVAVATLLVATIAWVVIIAVTQNFVTTFSGMATNSLTPQLGQTSILMGSITIVVVWVGLIAWMILSAFKKESQEGDLPLYD
jgi:phosphotransferase system  glucose/maltose/N-acetylglucosamine-specific IIC component